MGLLDSLFGKTETARQIPLEELKKLDVGGAAAEGRKAQKAGFAESEALATRTNVSASKAQRAQLESALPGFGGFQKQLGGLLTDIARDPFEVPESVFQQLKQTAAERGVSGGFLGSEFQEFNLLRNLGTTALQLGNQRIGQAQDLFRTLVSTAPTINPVSPLSFMPSTGDFIRGAETNIEVDKFNIIGKQQAAQSTENARAAAASKPGILTGLVQGGLSGFASGGPWGAVAGATLGAGSAAAAG